jgi:hypothetical protein
MSTTIIPDVLHICEQCGDVASGPCETCATIASLAETTAAVLLAAGKPLVFDPGAKLDEVELEWRASVTAAYRRQRTAQLYGSLPRVEVPLRGWFMGITASLVGWALLAVAWVFGRSAVRSLLN